MTWSTNQFLCQLYYLPKKIKTNLNRENTKTVEEEGELCFKKKKFQTQQIQANEAQI